MSKIKLRFISFFLVFTFLFFPSYQAKAMDGSTLNNAYLTLGTASALAPEAIPIFLGAAALVTTGVVVYKNADQIKEAGSWVINKAVEAGISVSSFVKDNTLVMTNEFKSFLKSIALSFPSSISYEAPITPSYGYPSIPHDGRTAYIVYLASGFTYLKTFDLVNANDQVQYSSGTIYGKLSSSPVCRVNTYSFYGDYTPSTQWNTISSSDSTSPTNPTLGFGITFIMSTFPVWSANFADVLFSPTGSVDVDFSNARRDSSKVSSYDVSRNIDAFPTNDVISFNPSIPLTDVGVSIPGQVVNDIGTIATDTEGAIPQTGNPSDTLPAPPIDMTLPNELSLDFTPLQVAFVDKFPFCVPFDLINSFKSFSAVKQTPKFDVSFDDDVFVGGGSFVIDFTPFNKIALILRYFILVVFLTNLIKLTRSIIKG